MIKYIVELLHPIQVGEEEVIAVNKLLAVLDRKNARTTTLAEIRQVATTNRIVVVRVNTGTPVPGLVVGMGTMIIVHKLGRLYGTIEDVATLDGHTGRGVGTMVMEALIAEAYQSTLKYVDLTSNPSRVAARRLYSRLNFEPRNTGCYRLTL